MECRNRVDIDQVLRVKCMDNPVVWLEGVVLQVGRPKVVDEARIRPLVLPFLALEVERIVITHHAPEKLGKRHTAEYNRSCL